jgi:co-chaperonin GroES (HSP10)
MGLFLSNDYEEIMRRLGEGLPRPYGPHVLLKLYTREETTQGGVVLPDSVREEAVYQGMTGMVLAIGPDAWQGEEFKHWQKPEVGTWVLFKPNSGVRFNDKNVPLRFVFDDAVLAPLQNPAWITR